MITLNSARFWRAALLTIALLRHGVLGQSTARTTRTTSSPSSTITADPFEGWQITGTTTIPVSCASGEVFVTSSSFAACCPSASSRPSRCNFATACENNNVVFKNGETFDCGALQCRLRKIFPSSQTEGRAFTEPLCIGKWEGYTLFREVPMTSGLVLPLTVADGAGAVTTEVSMMLTILGVNTSPSPTEAAASIAGSNTSNESSSPNFAAAILGAVFGTIAVIAIIISAFLYGRRRGMKKDQKSQPSVDTSRRNSYDSTGRDSRWGSASPYDRGIPLRSLSPREPRRAQHAQRSHDTRLEDDKPEWRPPAQSRPSDTARKPSMRRQHFITT